MPLNFAHRGASGHAPENTMAAFRLAIEQGADGIEFDLHQTADGGLVILHDFTLKRIAGDPREVRRLSLKQVRSTPIGTGRSAKFKNERIPTLKEVMGLVRNGPLLQIELKRGSPYYPDIEHRLLEAVLDNGLLNRVLISSFDTAALKTLRGLDPKVRIGLLTRTSGPGEIFREAESISAHSIHLSRRRFSSALLKGAHARGLSVYLYTVNRPDEMKRYLEMGADGLFTDYPDRLTALLKRWEPPAT